MLRTCFVLGVLVVMSAGCAQRPVADGGLVFLTREGCVNTARMRENLDAALRALNATTTYTVVALESLPADDVRTGYPTPTVLYENRDLFGFPPPTPPFPEPG